ncbi:hypothetical protein, partial [Achromobacter ruhlandii]|uniref:hypothetical protein n=1 Tax=Achromobacter ruhlandii TaxID=72557 RepID=UPI001C12B550
MAKSCGEPLREISDKAPSSVRTFFSPSAARGVGQAASSTIWFSGRPVSQGRASFAPRLASIVVQVGQLARSTWWQSCTCP